MVHTRIALNSTHFKCSFLGLIRGIKGAPGLGPGLDGRALAWHEQGPGFHPSTEEQN